MKVQLVDYAVVPTGDYPAVIEAVETTSGQYGEQLRFTLKLENADARMFAWCSTKFNSLSKLYQWVSAIFNGKPPVGFVLDTDKLISRKVIVSVSLVDTEKGQRNRVTDIKRYAEPTPPQPTGLSEYPA